MKPGLTNRVDGSESGDEDGLLSPSISYTLTAKRRNMFDSTHLTAIQSEFLAKTYSVLFLQMKIQGYKMDLLFEQEKARHLIFIAIQMKKRCNL